MLAPFVFFFLKLLLMQLNLCYLSFEHGITVVDPSLANNTKKKVAPPPDT
jgi:hypothetical protein